MLSEIQPVERRGIQGCGFHVQQSRTQRPPTCPSPWHGAHMHNAAWDQDREAEQCLCSGAPRPMWPWYYHIQHSFVQRALSPCANTCSWSCYPNTIHKTGKIMLMTISFGNKCKQTLYFSNPSHLPSWRPICLGHMCERLGSSKLPTDFSGGKSCFKMSRLFGNAFLEVFFSNFSCLYRNTTPLLLLVIGLDSSRAKNRKLHPYQN